MQRKIASFIMAIMIMAMAAVPAFAEAFDFDRTGSIAVTLKELDGKTPIAGVEFTLYHVATVGFNNDGNLSYVLKSEYKNGGIDLSDAEIAAKLDEFTRDASLPHEKKVTDGNGKAVFEALPLGLYLVKQTNTLPGYAACSPFLVTVPSEVEGGYEFDINASPKTDVARFTSITIKKVWNTDDSAPIAESVTVELLRNGEVVKTARLSEKNDWQVTYENMPESDGYSVVEINVPKGYTASYSRSGYVFTVTNSTFLIQTGQLIWPIPVLAMAGLILICAGAVILRKQEGKDA